MRHWMIGMAALAAATPVSAQVTLTPGQSITVTIGADGAAKASTARSAKPAPNDLTALGQLRGLYAANPPAAGEVAPAVPMHADTPPPRIAPDQAEVLFFVDGEDSVLALQNGYGRGLTYRARITAQGNSGPTDVCLVMPGRRGYEHWPFAIEKIELSEFALADWADGDPLPCR